MNAAEGDSTVGQKAVPLSRAARLLRGKLSGRVVLAGHSMGGAAAILTSESVGWQNFGKMLLVFGCIGTDFCKKKMKIRVLQHFSKSTRLSS